MGNNKGKMYFNSYFLKNQVLRIKGIIIFVVIR